MKEHDTVSWTKITINLDALVFPGVDTKIDNVGNGSKVNDTVTAELMEERAN